MRYDVIFISAAIVCLLLGEGYGLWLGASEQFQFAPVHAHMNLIGWASLALFGLIHRAFPALATAKLAPAQCILAIFSALTVPIGIYLVIASARENDMPVLVLSLLVYLSTILFAIMFFGKVALAKAGA